METLRFIVDAERLAEPEAQSALDTAAVILRGGGTVALPTETVYGLGANALDPVAVAKIFVAKQRPGWDPLIVHIADEPMLARIVNGNELPDSAQRLMKAFWPGPLTLLLPRSVAVPDAVTAGRALVGVRMPAHPVALELIRRAGVPIAAPSANSFGHTSPTTADHVLDDLDGRIDAVVDSGPTDFGVESTVINPCVSPMIIYRPGAITIEQIRAMAGPVELFVERTDPEAELAVGPREALPSPGVGLRHYAPRARLILVEGSDRELAALIDFQANSGERIGVMLPQGMGNEDVENLSRSKSVVIFPWGRWSRPDEMAHLLFAGLRHLDAVGCTVIVCPTPRGEGIAEAIRDRLRKAAYNTSPVPGI
ncbi:L-threonylcarbamoyladenylate synthase [Acidicapsa ligni]|uniref:L-threonylcarbamoyladenylate synthase n=1 Tax=Acidicapsa ligni TaxID=542300 RepID=UPI0021DFC209|nr:L-threonylcarbamoyladenylate synthase [Acidicapsa ligni]